MGQGESVDKLQEDFEVFRLQKEDNILLRNLRDQSEYLMRIVSCSNQADIDRIRGLLQERAQIKNNHIFSLVDIRQKIQKHLCSISYKMYIILSYSFKNITQEIKERAAEEHKRFFAESDIWSILYSCCIALNTLYSQGATHQCLTTSQIFMNKDGFVKIAQPLLFGLQKNHLRAMRTQNEGKIDVHVSPQIMSCLQNQNFFFYCKQKSDVFILAMIIIDISLLNSNYLYDPVYKITNLGCVQSLLTQVGQKFSSNLTDLLRQMLRINSKQRLSLSEAIQRIEKYHDLNRDLTRETLANNIESVNKKTASKPAEHAAAPNYISRVSFIKNPVACQTNVIYPINYVNVKPLEIHPKQVTHAPNQVSNVFNVNRKQFTQENPQIGRDQSKMKPRQLIPIKVGTQKQFPQLKNQINYRADNGHLITILPNTIIKHPAKLQKVQAASNVIIRHSPFISTFPFQQKMSQQNTSLNLEIQNKTDTKESPSLSQNWHINYKTIANMPKTQLKNIHKTISIIEDAVPNDGAINNLDEIHMVSPQKSNFSYETTASLLNTNNSSMNQLQNMKYAQSKYNKQSHNFEYITGIYQHRNSDKKEDQHQRLQFVKEEIIGRGNYEGYKLNNERNGYGCLYFKQGGRYEGEWKDDKMSGFGKLYFQDGNIAYEGHWENNQYNGQGRIYNENPCYFNGEQNYKDLSQLGSRWQYYDGKFKDDLKHGKGYVKLTNGQIFEGVFEKDTIEGSGLFYKQNGQIIIGFWIAGKLFLNQTYENSKE